MAHRLSPRALEVLEADSAWIANRVLPTEPGPVTEFWGPHRIRTGIVVGSVQSGKTASMIATAAHLLDRGIGITVILCGTQVGLWLQTYERLLDQLDGTLPANAYLRDAARTLIPSPEDVLNVEGRLDPDSYIKARRYEIKESVRSRRPIIIAIPKIDAHIAALTRHLETCCTPDVLSARGAPLTMAVFDDEADDASVLDACEGSKLTPRRIEEIWTLRKSSAETGSPLLFATYVAYTATPQANFLQTTHNPLAPRDFAATLRTPGVTGDLTPRGITFQEPKGLPFHYTGAQVFYEELRGQPGDLCRPSPFPERRPGEDEEPWVVRIMANRERMLGDALRCYLVGAAIRLKASRRSILEVRSAGPLTFEEVRRLSPSPHSMLYHPSGEMSAHFLGAAEIRNWSQGLPIWNALGSSPSDPPQEAVQLDPVGLAQRLKKEEPEWSRWLTEFRKTIDGLRFYPGASFPCLPDDLGWDEVREALVKEVFPSLSVKVINSSPSAAERPEFSPRPAPDAPGRFLPAGDLLTIFVAGNVLSRGVTIEGLATSLFLRSANEPAADTQMQMQRWLGYRGEILPLCRVFLHEDQLTLFREYHQADEATKAQVAAGMREADEPGFSGPAILHGDRHWATKKVKSSRLPLHPGPYPSIKLVEQRLDGSPDPNMHILADLLGSGNWREVRVDGGPIRGLILQEPVAMIKVADILDQFAYSHHAPRPDDDGYARWEAYARQLGIPGQLLRCPHPHSQGLKVSAEPSACPYSIAAYLRLWKALAEAPELGDLPTRAGYKTTLDGTPWSHIPREAHISRLPKFFLGVRFGPEAPCTSPLPREVRPMTRNIPRVGHLATLWGSRGTEQSYLGDQLFDYHHHRTSPIPTLHGAGEGWRPPGHPGLLLFHVIRDKAGQELLTAGLGIPKGGPDHIAALRG